MGIYGHKFDCIIEDSKVGNQPLEKENPSHPHEERINPLKKQNNPIQPIENNPDEDEFDKETRKENK